MQGRKGKLRPAVAWFAAGAVLLALSAAVGSRLRGGRASLTPPHAGVPSGVPAHVSLVAVALGGFRGVAADLLWLRAGRLQERRRFVELVQLSEWITALEPESEDVWSFHAWNLAYNVTILLGRPDDRWRWVQGAVSLLRDRGLAMNPDSPALEREIAWLFLHKIGSESDSASGFYQTAWSREISAWLGPNGEPPPEGSLSAAELLSALKMDASVMAELERRFGRVDWRVPDASALYWGALALSGAEGGPDEVPCRRMVYSALLSMMRRDGALVGDPDAEGWTFRAVPNLELVDATGAFLEETMQATSFSGVRHAYIGWLCDAILIRLAQGRESDAASLHTTLVDFFARHGVDGVPALADLATAPEGTMDELLFRAGFH